MWILRTELAYKPPVAIPELLRPSQVATRYSRFETKEAAEDYLLKLKAEYNVYNEEISELHLVED